MLRPLLAQLPPPERTILMLRLSVNSRRLKSPGRSACRKIHVPRALRQTPSYLQDGMSGSHQSPASLVVCIGSLDLGAES